MNAFVIVWFHFPSHNSRIILELQTNFFYHSFSGNTNTFHSHGTEPVWKHGTNQEEGEHNLSGPAGQISIDFNTGYGFTAIIVAFLGRLHPIGILLAGLLMALTYIGGEIAQSQMGLPAAAIQVFQGMLLFFLLAVDVLTSYRMRLAPGGAKTTKGGA